VLAALNLDKEFRVEADASNYATGGILSMKCSDEKWRPVAFISKSLSDTEQNCYDLVKWLSHYLIFLFIFILFSF